MKGSVEMPDATEVYRRQINELVYVFTQLWIRVGAALPEELAHVRDLVSDFSGDDSGVSNYEQFFRISSNLCHAGSMTMGELAAALSLPQSTATRVVDWLVADGYGERLADSQDRRVVRVTLTETGRKLYLAMEKYIAGKVEYFLEPATDAEKATLFSLIGKVAAGGEMPPATPK
jgi:DNA-binding MarR family transcriptional regulator